MTAGPIRAPRWPQPVFAAPDEALTVVVDAPRTAEVAFCLSIDRREVELEVQAVEAVPEAGVVLYRVGLPGKVEEGLADLKFVENGVLPYHAEGGGRLCFSPCPCSAGVHQRLAPAEGD